MDLSSPRAEVRRMGVLCPLRRAPPSVHPRPTRAFLAASAFLLAFGCGLANEDAAPTTRPARHPGPCGTTEDLFPRFLAFLEADRFQPLRSVIETRLVHDDSSPGGPSLRTTVRAALDVVARVGSPRAVEVLSILDDPEVEGPVSTLLTSSLRIIDGQVDGILRYEVSSAAGRFIRTCDPDNLLAALEGLIRLRREDGTLWLSAVLERSQAILEDETVVPFLTAFEQGADTGRPAIVALFGQVMTFLATDENPVDRVRTLLESVVYPLLDSALVLEIEGLLTLLEEATDAQAAVYGPLQGALRCGNRQPEARDELLGFLYDLVVVEALGLTGLLDTANILRSTSELQLELLSDLLAAVREDVGARDEFRAVLSVLLEKETAPQVVPVAIELVDEGIVAELLDGARRLLDGCSEQAASEAGLPRPRGGR